VYLCFDLHNRTIIKSFQVLWRTCQVWIGWSSAAIPIATSKKKNRTSLLLLFKTKWEIFTEMTARANLSWILCKNKSVFYWKHDCFLIKFTFFLLSCLTIRVLVEKSQNSMKKWLKILFIFYMTIFLFAGVRRRSFRSVRRKRKRRGQELFELPRTKNIAIFMIYWGKCSSTEWMKFLKHSVICQIISFIELFLNRWRQHRNRAGSRLSKESRSPLTKTFKSRRLIGPISRNRKIWQNRKQPDLRMQILTN